MHETYQNLVAPVCKTNSPISSSIIIIDIYFSDNMSNISQLDDEVHVSKV